MRFAWIDYFENIYFGRVALEAAIERDLCRFILRLGPQVDLDRPRMKELFSTIKTGGAKEVERLVSERQPETVDLEFKTKAYAGSGDVRPVDRDKLGEVLSAFANSSGGLLIWGIEASKGPDGIDCATALRPISEIERFRSDVQRLAAQALMRSLLQFDSAERTSTPRMYARGAAGQGSLSLGAHFLCVPGTATLSSNTKSREFCGH